MSTQNPSESPQSTETEAGLRIWLGIIGITLAGVGVYLLTGSESVADNILGAVSLVGGVLGVGKAVGINYVID